MKIVILNDRVYGYASGDLAAVGGAERQQWLLAKSLVADHCAVTVGVRGFLKLGYREVVDGVEFVGIGQGFALLAWYRFLVSERPDWLYWRGAEHWLGPIVELSKLAKVRTIFAVAFDADLQPRRALSRRQELWPLFSWGLKRVTRIFAQYQDQLSLVDPQWRGKAFVVPSIATQRDSVKAHVNRENYVAWVGVLRKPKRPDLLVNIIQNAPTISFVVCGGASAHRSPPGYSEGIIEQLRRLPNVRFLGPVHPEVAQQTIGDAAVLLSTSDEEGFPNTFLEAWANGTPVVSLKIDPDSIIKQARLGMVSNTIPGAIEDIETLLSSVEQRDEISVRARKYIEECRSETIVVKSVFHALSSSP